MQQIFQSLADPLTGNFFLMQQPIVMISSHLFTVKESKIISQQKLHISGLIDHRFSFQFFYFLKLCSSYKSKVFFENRLLKQPHLPENWPSLSVYVSWVQINVSLLLTFDPQLISFHVVLFFMLLIIIITSFAECSRFASPTNRHYITQLYCSFFPSIIDS